MSAFGRFDLATSSILSGGMPQKILIVLGTRPEAIKLAPVILALRADWRFTVTVCSSGQHRDMIAPILALFGIDLDHDLGVMRPGQSLHHVAASVIAGLQQVIAAVAPDLVIVQGDTTTAFAGAVAAHYSRVAVAHVEAGLRTGDLDAPWPEEANRKMIGAIAALHFAPTATAAQNLMREGIDAASVVVAGNTVIDAAHAAARLTRADDDRAVRLGIDPAGPPVILFTMHRRESFGAPVERVFAAMRRLVAARAVQLLFPVHPNPNIAPVAHRILGDLPGVRLCAPLDYADMIVALGMSRFVITDSGGLVEEAAAFHKPALVLRDTTERAESVDAGGAILCGTDDAMLLRLAGELLDDGALYRRMSTAPNPFGDGHAATRILDTIALRQPMFAVAA